MLEREAIIAELWKRLALVDGVVFTARNPKQSPAESDLPAIMIFELGDAVVEESMRGGYPIYRRALDVIIEAYVKPNDEQSASKELGLFVQEIKKQVYAGGTNLGKKCSTISETDAGRILRPPIGSPVIGVGLAFKITYVENIQLLF